MIEANESPFSSNPLGKGNVIAISADAGVTALARGWDVQIQDCRLWPMLDAVLAECGVGARKRLQKVVASFLVKS